MRLFPKLFPKLFTKEKACKLLYTFVITTVTDVETVLAVNTGVLLRHVLTLRHVPTRSTSSDSLFFMLTQVLV
jgi:hypothetical protein